MNQRNRAMPPPGRGYAVRLPGVAPPRSAPLPVAVRGAEGRPSVAILGGGVGGLTVAYELQRAGCKCILVEARSRTGGRCLTLRKGDTVIEDCFDTIQVCEFEDEPVRQSCEGYPPYFNAGPGRISSSHVHLLSYLRQFRVALEIYVMQSGSNLVYVAEQSGVLDRAVPNRHLDNDTRGRLASLLYGLVDDRLQMPDLGAASATEFDLRRRQLKSLLVQFGDLAAQDGPGYRAGDYIGSTRSGYRTLPEVEPQPWVRPFSLGELLSSAFWERTSFYLPQEFLWQPTMLQPVGGMDHVAEAFQRNALEAGVTILTDATVQHVSFDDERRHYVIEYQTKGVTTALTADLCVSNVPLPLLRDVLDDRHFAPSFRQALHAVYEAQYFDAGDPTRERFLAPATKLGWQAPQGNWCGLPPPGSDLHPSGTVPIFGGISWTADEINQIWYPSAGVQNELGILTGAYNYADAAQKWGHMPPEQRLVEGRAQAARLGGAEFAASLRHGISIAWQNIEHIKGGWPQWHALDADVPDPEIDAHIAAGGQPCTRSAFYYNRLVLGDQGFHIVGDQMSDLPGWQEGAVISAINAVNKITDPTFAPPQFVSLTDSRVVVEGRKL